MSSSVSLEGADTGANAMLASSKLSSESAALDAIGEARGLASSPCRCGCPWAFIAVTVPPVDAAVTAPFASTITITVQSSPPAAQLNSMSPWVTDWPASISRVSAPAMKPAVTPERSTSSGTIWDTIPSSPPPPQP